MAFLPIGENTKNLSNYGKMNRKRTEGIIEYSHYI